MNTTVGRVGRGGELLVEPLEPGGVELAVVVAVAQRVEADEAHVEVVDRVRERIAVAREVRVMAERGHELGAVVVVAGDQVGRDVDGIEQLAEQRVLGRGAVVDEIAGEQEHVGTRRHRREVRRARRRGARARRRTAAARRRARRRACPTAGR